MLHWTSILQLTSTHTKCINTNKRLTASFNKTTRVPEKIHHLDFNEARDDVVMQWHRPDHMQTMSTLLLTDNHANTSSQDVPSRLYYFSLSKALSSNNCKWPSWLSNWYSLGHVQSPLAPLESLLACIIKSEWLLSISVTYASDLR